MVLPMPASLEYIPHSRRMPCLRISMDSHRLPELRTNVSTFRVYVKQ